MSTLKKLEGSQEINGHPCRGYVQERDGKKERELWVTDWKRFDLKAADFAEASADAWKQVTEFIAAHR